MIETGNSPSFCGSIQTLVDAVEERSVREVFRGVAEDMNPSRKDGSGEAGCETSWEGLGSVS
jgi:hypothetical protein